MSDSTDPNVRNSRNVRNSHNDRNVRNSRNVRNDQKPLGRTLLQAHKALSKVFCSLNSIWLSFRPKSSARF